MYVIEDHSSIERVLQKIGLICFELDSTDGQPRFLWTSLVAGLGLIACTFPLTVYGLLVEVSSAGGLETKLALKSIQSFCLLSTSLLIFLASSAGYTRASTVYKYIGTVTAKLPGSPRTAVSVNLLFLMSSVTYACLLVADYFACTRPNNLCYWNIPTYVLQAITYLFVMQIFGISYQIHQLFKDLNEHIASVLQCNNIEFSTDIKFTLPCVESPLSPPWQETFDLGSCADMHWALCRAVGHFNEAFGLQLLAHFFTIFQHLIDSPYVISLIASEGLNSWKTYYKAIVIILSAAFYSLQLCVVVVQCGRTTAEANSARSVLARHLRPSLCHGVKTQVKSFILLLEEDDAKFSVCGLFKLHESVITAVTAAVTTYLVILFQIQTQ